MMWIMCGSELKKASYLSEERSDMIQYGPSTMETQGREKLIPTAGKETNSSKNINTMKLVILNLYL